MLAVGCGRWALVEAQMQGTQGPLKILTFRTPTPETEKMFEASFNATLDRYRSLLTELEIEPAIESLEKCGRLSLCLVISGFFPQAGVHLKTFCTALSGCLSCGCRLSSLRLHAAVTYIAKQSNANGKKPKYPGIGISKIFHCWNMGKI